MKTSEVIKQLSEIVEKRGDLELDYQLWLEDKLAATTEPKGVQITIKEEYNLKVAAWLMQNGIEHSSTPTEPKEVVKDSLTTESDAVEFHKWMKENDTPERAEEWFHYSDEDMYKVFKSSKK